MEAIRERLNPLVEQGNLDKSITDIQAAIDALNKAKEKVANGEVNHSTI